jgi:hypothetical protein
VWSRIGKKLWGDDRQEQARQHAEKLEQKGLLLEAMHAFISAGLTEDALRVCLSLADTEVDPRTRIRWLAQASTLTSERAIRARYALARLDFLRAGAIQSVLPSEFNSLAKELLDLEEADAAAAAFRLAGQHEAAFHALVEAGSTEELESYLDEHHESQRQISLQETLMANLEHLDLSGQRRQALALLEQQDLPSLDPHHALRRAHQQLQMRLCSKALLRVQLLEESTDELLIVMGKDVVLGRSDAALIVRSPVISRKHLRFFRDESGQPCLETLNDRNGTSLRGMRLQGKLVLAHPTELQLGGQIVVKIQPHAVTGLLLDVHGKNYWLPLGPLSLGPWQLESQPAGYRLQVPKNAPAPILNSDIAAAEGIDLCRGDEIRTIRNGPVILKVLGD